MAIFDFFAVSSNFQAINMSDVKSGGFCRIVSLRALIQGPWIQGFLIRPTNNHSFVVFFLEGGGNSDSFNCCKFCFFKKKLLKTSVLNIIALEFSFREGLCFFRCYGRSRGGQPFFVVASMLLGY